MTTPNKFGDFSSSPYDKPLAQKYPSQSEDYLSLEAGGSKTFNYSSNAHSFKKQLHTERFHKTHGTPYNYNSKPNNDNYRKRPFKNDYNSNKKQYNHTQAYNFSAYFHPSMLKDPWQHLMKRFDDLGANSITGTDS